MRIAYEYLVSWFYRRVARHPEQKFCSGSFFTCFRKLVMEAWYACNAAMAWLSDTLLSLNSCILHSGESSALSIVSVKNQHYYWWLHIPLVPFSIHIWCRGCLFLPHTIQCGLAAQACGFSHYVFGMSVSLNCPKKVGCSYWAVEMSIDVACCGKCFSHFRDLFFQEMEAVSKATHAVICWTPPVWSLMRYNGPSTSQWQLCVVEAAAISTAAWLLTSCSLSTNTSRLNFRWVQTVCSCRSRCCCHLPLLEHHESFCHHSIKDTDNHNKGN